MKIVCAHCERDGNPNVIAEKPPLDDPTITHGICPRHLQLLQEEIATWQATKNPVSSNPGQPAV